jgi:hypothetical protein
MTPSGIDPAAFWFVAQYLNHWAETCSRYNKHLGSANTTEHSWLQFNDSLKMCAVGIKHYVINSRQEACSTVVFLLLSFNIRKYKSRFTIKLYYIQKFACLTNLQPVRFLKESG